MAAVQGQIGEYGPFTSFVDKRRSTAANAVTNTSVLATPLDYTSRNTMEVYLVANGYTQTTLNQMNANDVLFAYRMKKDLAGI